jgi:hypothetical protein
MTDFNAIEFGLLSTTGEEVVEGDVVLWKNPELGEPRVCLVYWDHAKYAFRLQELDGIDPNYATSYMREGDYAIIGNRYDKGDIHVKWSRIGQDPDFPHRSNFLKQGISSTCFPLAAINACVGAGVKKAFFNFRLYKKMIHIGECEKWGGCIDEQAVLNELQANLNVEFVEADMESVLEVGGILTMKAACFHAAAVFVHDGQPYLVNSNIEEGQFIRPLIDIDEIPRSDDPDHHRDYMLVLGESYH